MSDTKVFFGMLVFFIMLGALLPFVTSEFSPTTVEHNIEGTEFTTGQALTTDSTGVFQVILSVITIFFWSVGSGIPIIFELIILEPLRILFYWLFYRQIRGIGG